MRYVQKTSSQLLNEIHLYICCCQQKEALGVSTKIKAPITFINVSIVILLLFCKINKKDNYKDNNTHYNSYINTFIITFTQF